MTQGDLDEDRPLIDHVIPSTLLKAAVALNDMIYISCERMECKEHDVYDGFDNLPLKNSIDATEVTLSDYTDYSNDHSSRNETKDSSPDPTTNYSSVNKINRSSKNDHLNSQHKDKSKYKDETIYVPVVSSRKPRIEEKNQLQKQDTRSLLAALAYGDSRLATSQRKTEQSSKIMKTKIVRSLNTNRQHPEKSRPSGNSIRHFKRSLSKYIRPAKGENAERPDLSSNRDKKDHAYFVDQRKIAQNVYIDSSRTFRPKFLYANNESTRDTHNSGPTSRSAIFDQPIRSHRTSNLDLSNVTEEQNYSGHYHQSAIFDQQEDEPTKKVEENEVSGRSFRTTFLSRGRSKSRSQHKRTSLMSRLRGRERSPSRRKTRDKKYASTEIGTITKKTHHKREEEQGNVIRIPSAESNKKSDDDGKENGNINNKYESIQSPQNNNGTFTRKYTETKTKESHVFLAPNNSINGQEIAPQDGNYYCDDPGQVHSFLTMPTFGTLAATTYNNDRPIKEIQFQKEIAGRNNYKYE
jgi:hypothetical protein